MSVCKKCTREISEAKIIKYFEEEGNDDLKHQVSMPTIVESDGADSIYQNNQLNKILLLSQKFMSSFKFS